MFSQVTWHRPLAALIVITALLALSTVAFGQEGAAVQRADIAESDQWNLSDLYPTEAAWEEAFAGLDTAMALLTGFKDHLSESPEMLLNCLKLRDSLSIINDNLYVYSHLQLDQDQRVNENQELSDRAEGIDSRFGTTTSFIVPEILSLGADRLQTILQSSPELDEYRFFFEDLIRSEEYVLSPREEELLSMAGEMSRSARAIFNMTKNADISFGMVTDEDGNEVQLTTQRYSQMLQSSDRRVRREANEMYVQTYEKYINTLAATLSSSFRADQFYTKARGFNTSLERRLYEDNIPTDVFFNLIEAVNNNLAPLNKWTTLKKRVLGLDTMFTYDQRAPLLDRKPPEYTYEEAKQIVLEGLKPLGEPYLTDMKKGLESGWIDVYENEGKRGGAYNWGTYTSHPYILLNFVGTRNNVFTLAHELGHAMHSYYRHQVEPYAYGDATTFTAEVASTANEAVLMKYLLEKTTDREDKIELLIDYIQQIEGTLYTQVFFSEFELAMHKQVEEGGAFSADYMRKTYRDLYQKYWGPDVYIDPLNDMGCVRISHFYRNYYVFQYATSYAASQVLSQRVLAGEPGAVESLMKFLHTGSSKYPMDILLEANVDLSSPEPVDKALKLFGELVDEVERLLDES